MWFILKLFLFIINRMSSLISVKEVNNTYIYDRKDYVRNVRKNIYIKDKNEYIKKNNKYILIDELKRRESGQTLILSEKWAEKPCVQDCLVIDKICNLKTKRCKSPPNIKIGKK